MNSLPLTRQIKQKALSLGFNAVGIALPQIKTKESEALQSYLKSQYHDKMDYLAKNTDLRKNIQLLFPQAKSIIMVLASYVPNVKTNASRYKIAYYTFSNDYHIVVKSKLNELLEYIKNTVAYADGFVFCDTLPVFEKSYAVSAGLGWIGKNGLLINYDIGSYCVIGGIALNIDLTPDNPIKNTCPDSCNLCTKACPTGAIIKPYILNASNCVSYLTVENKESKLPVNNPTSYIAGCDLCQIACPYNANIDKNQNRLFETLSHVYWTDSNWEALTTSTYKKELIKTSIGRIGLKTLRRNIAGTNKKGEN